MAVCSSISQYLTRKQITVKLIVKLLLTTITSVGCFLYTFLKMGCFGKKINKYVLCTLIEYKNTLL